MSAGKGITPERRREIEARLAMPKQHCFACGNCGHPIKVDEDECCTGCGGQAYPMTDLEWFARDDLTILLAALDAANDLLRATENGALTALKIAEEKLDAAESQRDALRKHVICHPRCAYNKFDGARCNCGAERVLLDTAPAARERDDRIRAEERELCIAAVDNCLSIDGVHCGAVKQVIRSHRDPACVSKSELIRADDQREGGE